MMTTTRWVSRGVLALTLLAGAAGAQDDAAPSDPAIESEALEIGERAGDFLRDAGRFRFTAEIGYEVVQRDGVRLEFGSARTYEVVRPAQVRVETEQRSGEKRLTVFDGTTFVVADLTENAYAQADLKQPRDIDFLIDTVRDRLDMPLPLAELLRNDPRASLTEDLEAAAWVGAERLRGFDCDHLLLRNPDADVQLWIERGEHPWLRRVVITYRTLEGAPSFWANLDDWTLGGESDPGRFRFTPPEGAERVRFEVRPTKAPTEGGAS